MSAQWLRAGEGALLLRYRNEVSPEAHALVRNAFEALETWEHPALLNLHPAYGSLLIEFDPLQVSFDEWRRQLEPRFAAHARTTPSSSRLVEIPVHYDGEDLSEVASLHGMTTEDVVRFTARPSTRCTFSAFSRAFRTSRGFPKSSRLQGSRLPRLQVPAGSVAIAGKQAGIYPEVSAGGWRLLGRTPLRLFQSGAPSPTLLRMGDRVKFRSISRKELDHA